MSAIKYFLCYIIGNCLWKLSSIRKVYKAQMEKTAMTTNPTDKTNAESGAQSSVSSHVTQTYTEKTLTAVRQPNLDALLSSKIHLDSLKAGVTKNAIYIRLLRMWEAKNFKLNGALMSLDMLLLDEKDNLVQGSIYHRRIHMYKGLLDEGRIYLISNFEVVPAYSHYKVTDNPFTIRFTDTTQVNKVDEEVSYIKHEKFRAHSYSEFQRFAGTNIHLLDVVGQILSLQGPNLDDPKNTQKIVMLLLLGDKSTIRLTLWDDQAASFRGQYKQTANSCSVIVATCMNPKLFAGKLYLNSSGATKVYVDLDLQIVKDFMIRMGIETTESATPVIENEAAKPVLEILTIQEILDYISNGLNLTKEAICYAKVVEVNQRGGWKYLSCGACAKKLTRSENSLICNNCDASPIVGVAKFRVELIVESEDRTATFVIFDRDARKIAKCTAEDLTQTEAQGDGSSGSQTIPKCLLGLTGKTLAFQIKISKYNFETSSQNFTVTRIIQDKQPDKPETPDLRKDNKKIKIEDGDIRPTFYAQEVPNEIDVANRVENNEGETQEDTTKEEEDVVEKSTKKMRMD